MHSCPIVSPEIYDDLNFEHRAWLTWWLDLMKVPSKDHAAFRNCLHGQHRTRFNSLAKGWQNQKDRERGHVDPMQHECDWETGYDEKRTAAKKAAEQRDKS